MDYRTLKPERKIANHHNLVNPVEACNHAHNHSHDQDHTPNHTHDQVDHNGHDQAHDQIPAPSFVPYTGRKANHDNRYGVGPMPNFRNYNESSMLGSVSFNCRECDTLLVITPFTDYITCACGLRYQWVVMAEQSIQKHDEKEAQIAVMRSLLLQLHDEFIARPEAAQFHQSVTDKIEATLAPTAGRAFLKKMRRLERAEKYLHSTRELVGRLALELQNHSEDLLFNE